MQRDGEFGVSGSSSPSRAAWHGIVVLYCVLFYLVDHNFRFSLVFADGRRADTTLGLISSGTAKRQVAVLLLGVSGVFLLISKRRPIFVVPKSVGALLGIYLAWTWLSASGLTTPFSC